MPSLLLIEASLSLLLSLVLLAAKSRKASLANMAVGKLGLGFRGYVNALRLEAVCRDFRERPCDSILEVAFENGFNSKSSFNTLFHAKFGMTPREYKNSLYAEGRPG